MVEVAMMNVQSSWLGCFGQFGNSSVANWGIAKCPPHPPNPPIGVPRKTGPASSPLSERRFTADAARELRTPIAAIRAQAQAALGGLAVGVLWPPVSAA
jgi:hypothetical protein